MRKWATFSMVAALVLLATGCGSLLEGEKTVPESKRPNFVFIMTDDLDERSMKDLDGIRQIMGSEGTTFENAYVSYSLCCPSRVTFFRGQYAHNHGIISGKNSLGEPRFHRLGLDQSTVATWLDDAGYRTKFLGKYINGYSEFYTPPGWDEWFAFKGGASKNWINDDGERIILRGNSNDAFADEAGEFIERSSEQRAPFFVMVGSRAPHRPPEIPLLDTFSFADAALPKPPNFNETDVSDKPEWVQSYPKLRPAQIEKRQEQYRERLRSMLPVEDLLTQTIATLRETGELDDTYIFFTSDNGFHMGNHRLDPAGKRTPYEEDIGVLLMVRGPGVPAGEVREQLVINNDFAPTMADLADTSVPAFVDGRSFAPLLTDSPPQRWRTAFLEEGWFERAKGSDASAPTPTNKGVHTQDHMFVEYDTGEYELYDLDRDPHQLQSMTRSEDEALYSQLNARLEKLKDCAGKSCRDAEGP